MAQIKENFAKSEHNIHIVNSFDHQDFIELYVDRQDNKRKKVMCRAEHANESHNYHDYKIVNCQPSAPSNCFTQSVIFDFALPCNFDIIQNTMLIMTLNNLDATNSITPCYTPFFFQNIKIKYQGVVIHTIYPQELYLQLRLRHTDEELYNLVNVCNLNGDQSIAASGSKILYLPLNCFLD